MVFIAILIILLIAAVVYVGMLLKTSIKKQEETVGAISSLTQNVIVQYNSLQSVKLQIASLEESVLELSVNSINIKAKLKNFVFSSIKNNDFKTTIESAGNVMNVPLNKAKRMLLVLVELKIISVIGDEIEFRIKKEQLSKALEKIDLFFNGEMRY
ncbi:MAG: hypothetical protein HUK19_00545 [Fibrobacter sp.]|nr:hypothetical protein [Fibrobacter sp.]